MRGGRLLVLVLLAAGAARCGDGTRPPLRDGAWRGDVVAVDVARRTLRFAPACGGAVTLTVAPRADLEIYFRPNGDPGAGHGQPADLRNVEQVAEHRRSPDFPSGWFVTVRDGDVVAAQEDSGLRETGHARRARRC